MMRAWLLVLTLAFTMFAGCVSVDDPAGNDTDPAEGEDDMEGGTEDEADTDEGLTGGDPEDDTTYKVGFEIPSSARWTHKDHHFRMPLRLPTGVDAGEQVRFTVDVGVALHEAGLEWIHPNTGIEAIDPDVQSAVLERISSAGVPQEVMPLESRSAGERGMELAFRHKGGDYILYFDDERNEAPQQEPTLFPNAPDTTAHRGDAQWQGDGLWGAAGVSDASTVTPGSKIARHAWIHNDGRDPEQGAEPLVFELVARAPADWTEVTVSPDGESKVTSSRRVTVEGWTSPEGSGTDTLYLDIISEQGHKVAVSFTITYD